jgi:hypothetical protein
MGKNALATEIVSSARVAAEQWEPRRFAFQGEAAQRGFPETSAFFNWDPFQGLDLGRTFEAPATGQPTQPGTIQEGLDDRDRSGWRGPGAATPEQLARRFERYWEIGFSHIYFDYAAPWDDETLERLISDVKPLIAERTGEAAKVGTA